MTDLISVMIVDDEKLMLEDLSTMIDWEAYGYQIIATAFNGKQALRKYREYHPQVIFTDIRMPFMDGIEMISEIRKKDEKVSIVLLTAYEDFSYAKAAIRLGITEYVIKSEITENSLSELLNRLKANIIKAGKRERYITDRMLEQFFLSEEMTESADVEQILKRPEHIIMVEQDLPISLSGEAVPEEIVVHRSKFVEILTNEKITGWDLDVITAIPGRKMVIALSSTESSYGSYEQELYKLARKFQKKLQEETNSSFSLYIVQGRISLYEFKRFYDENKNVFLEKYLVTITGYAAFKIFIPAACVLFAANMMARNRSVDKLARRLLIFGICIFLVVPASVKVSDLIETTYQSQIDATLEDAKSTQEMLENSSAAQQEMEQAQQSTDQNTAQQETGISGIFDKAKDALSSAKDSVTTAVENVTISSEELVQKVQNSLNHFVEAVAVMLITSCVIPILVLLVFFWLIKVLLDVDISGENPKSGV